MPGGIVQGIAALKAADKQVKASEQALGVVERLFAQTRADLGPQIELGQEATNFLRGLFFQTGPDADLFGGSVTEQIANPARIALQQQLSQIEPTIPGVANENREGDFRANIQANPEFNNVLARLQGTPETISRVKPGAGGGETDIGDFVRRFDPTFDFRRSEGLEALDRSAAARGLLNSGAQQRAAIQFGENVAQGGSENFLNRISQLAGFGTNTAIQQGGFQSQNALAQAGIIQDAGTARASGIIGAGQGFGSALNNAAQFASFAAGCVVAREVFGEDSPKWRIVREWMFTRAPARLRDFYLEHGPSIAAWLKDRPDEKERFRVLMNEVVDGLPAN